MLCKFHLYFHYVSQRHLQLFSLAASEANDYSRKTLVLKWLHQTIKASRREEQLSSLLALPSARKRKPFSVLLNLLPRVPKCAEAIKKKLYKRKVCRTGQMGYKVGEMLAWMQNDVWWMYATQHL